MFRLFLALLLLVATLTASEYDQKLRQARQSIHAAQKSVVWRGYHDFQSLYMKGLLEQDSALQIAALKGLIEASGRLGLDPSRYRNALKILDPSAQAASGSKRPPASQKGSASGSGGKKKSPKASNPTSSKRTDPAKEPLLKGGKRRIVETKVADQRLELRFASPPGKGDLHPFVLHRRKHHLYVFDIKGAELPYAIRRIKGKGFDEIRIAQYDPHTVRVVIETTRAYKPDWRIEGNRLLFALPQSTSAASAKQRRKKSSKKQSTSRRRGAPSKAVATPKASTVAVSTAAVPAMGSFTVVIDPGHGGRDSGAVGYMKRREKDAVLAVARQLKSVLQKRGFKVYMTRSSDRFVPLKKRTRFANRKHADFFISIHANAAASKRHWSTNHGIETYFLSRARTGRAKRVAAIENRAEIKNIDRYTKEAYLSVLNREKIIESNKLAIDLQRQMLTSLRSRYRKVVDGGVREGPFWVLVGAQMPAVLIEIGYITHPVESGRLFSPRYQKLLAEGIANGIQSYIYHNR